MLKANRYKIFQLLYITSFNYRLLPILFLIIILIYLTNLSIIGIVNYVLYNLGYLKSTNLTIPIVQRNLQLILYLFNIVILVPLLEEFLYRGILLKAFSRKIKPNVLIVSIAIVNSALHFNFIQLIPYILLFYILGYIVLKTNSIFCAIIIHSLYNFVAFVFKNNIIPTIYNKYFNIYDSVVLMTNLFILIPSVILIILILRLFNKNK